MFLDNVILCVQLSKAGHCFFWVLGIISFSTTLISPVTIIFYSAVTAICFSLRKRTSAAWSEKCNLESI